MSKPAGFYKKDGKTRPRFDRKRKVRATKVYGKRKQSLRVPKRTVKQIQSRRSSHARKIDNAMKAKVVSAEEWKTDPSRGDLKGIDTPSKTGKDLKGRKTKHKTEKDKMNKSLTLINQHRIRLTDDDNLRVLGNPFKKTTQKDIKEIKTHKPEIVKELKRQKKAEELEQKKKNLAYEKLAKQLPKREIKSTPNKAKFEKLMKEANAVQFYDGPEMDGVNLGQSAKKRKLIEEAQKYCNHELQTSYVKTLTPMGDKEVQRTIRCPKCNLELHDKIAEDKMLERHMRSEYGNG